MVEWFSCRVCRLRSMVYSRWCCAKWDEGVESLLRKRERLEYDVIWYSGPLFSPFCKPMMFMLLFPDSDYPIDERVPFDKRIIARPRTDHRSQKMCFRAKRQRVNASVPMLPYISRRIHQHVSPKRVTKNRSHNPQRLNIYRSPTTP